MFATPIRLAANGGQPGFWRRSLAELKRQSKIAVRLEGLQRPNQPFPLARFEQEDSLGGIKVMSDADMAARRIGVANMIVKCACCGRSDVWQSL
jgi:NADH dehydrogenase [ubiquinone] 1 alpha subcomplex assembly factor 1